MHLSQIQKSVLLGWAACDDKKVLLRRMCVSPQLAGGEEGAGNRAERSTAKEKRQLPKKEPKVDDGQEEASTIQILAEGGRSCAEISASPPLWQGHWPIYIWEPKSFDQLWKINRTSGPFFQSSFFI